MYKVIKFFTDLQDDNHPYNVGDIFPRKGLKVTEERLLELSSGSNKQGVALIEKVDEVEKTTKKKPTTKKKETK